MKVKREKLRIFCYNMTEHSQLLIQEDVSQRNSEEVVLEPEDKRVTDENFKSQYIKKYKI